MFLEQFFDTGSIENIKYDDPVSNNHLESISEHLPRFARPPLATESLVVHPQLEYKGYLDCVTICYDERNLKSKSKLVLIDWKTSQKSKETLQSTFDNPLQVAAYIGAFNHDKNYPAQVTEGLIVIIYNDGRPAKLLPISQNKLEIYWKAWLQRLNLYSCQRPE